MSSLTSLASLAAINNGIPPSLFLAQIQAESGFNSTAYNPSSGATGIAQFLPSTAAQPGYGIAPFDPRDPVASLNAAAQYDGALYNRTGSYGGMLDAYGTRNPGVSQIAQGFDSGGFRAQIDPSGGTSPADPQATLGGGSLPLSNDYCFGDPETGMTSCGQGLPGGGVGGMGGGPNSPAANNAADFLKGSFLRLGIFIIAAIVILGGIYALATSRQSEVVNVKRSA